MGTKRDTVSSPGQPMTRGHAPAQKRTADWDEGKLVWWLKFRLPNLTVGSTPAAEVRPTKTAGHGLFTTIEISAGALVSRVGGAASWFRGARCIPRSARIRQHHLGRQRSPPGSPTPMP